MRAKRECGSGRSPAGARSVLCLVLLAVAGSAAGASPEVVPDHVPAAGEHAVTVRVAATGRYALAAGSLQGVALVRVDRLAGEVAASGAAGREDGRLDLFLEPGETRVRVSGPELGRGEAALTLTPFRELHSGVLPLLDGAARLSTELGDFEQRSWWVRIEAGEPFLAEAAGRHLADLRLWQGGDWLLPAEPACAPIEPVAGQPLTLCRLHAAAPPGLYRLSAYGGAGLAWARAGAERPLHLRLGTARRGEAGRERLAIGPFGFERFALPGSATLARLELPEPGGAALRFGDLDPAEPFAEPWESAEIDEESLPPVATLWRGETEGEAVLLVSGSPGQEVVLQHLRSAREAPVAGAGPHWVGSVHTGAAGDAIDATALLVERRPEGRSRLLARQAVEIAPGSPWRRRFQLDGPATLFVEVAEAGAYELTATGAAVEARIEPLLLSPPQGYRPPALRQPPLTWELEAGLYTLTLRPAGGGLVEATLREKGTPRPSTFTPPLTATRLGKVELDPALAYTLWVNEQPGVETGPVVRSLPVDLAAPLPLALRPGDEVEIPVLLPAAGRLRATAEDGSPWELSADGAPWSIEPEVTPGEIRLRVRSTAGTSAGSLSGSLAFAPAAIAPAAAGDALAEVPLLEDGLSLSLGRREARSFRFRVEREGFHTLASTGLLATAGSLRSRVLPPFAQAEANGTGRNFRLAAWLPEGEYQLLVETLGESAGPAGLVVRRAETRDGGDLVVGLAARAGLGAGEGISHRLAVAAPGRYRVEALRAGAPAPFRLEDAAGFPALLELAGEGADGPYEAALGAGEHRLLVLPGAPAGPVVTAVERRPEAPRTSGHGPHDLPLGVEREHLWREPQEGEGEGAVRLPDRWSFSLPAAAEVTLVLAPEMEGAIVAAGAEDGTAGEPLPAVRPARLRLAAGEHELRVRSVRLDDLRPYRLRLDPVPLVAGLVREVAAPGEIEIAVGATGTHLFESFGRADVRARLLDEAGREVARGDDRPGDWNFLLSPRLDPGRYRLRVDPVGAPGASTRVAMHRVAERALGAWTASGAHRVELDGEAAIVPLELAPRAELLAVSARAEVALGLRVDQEEAGGWREIAAADGPEAQLALPLAGRPALRLRLVSLDRRPVAVDLHGFAGRPRELRERDLLRGGALAPLAGFAPPLAVAEVRLARPGCLRIAGRPAGLLAATAPLRPLAPAGEWLVTATDRLWLAAAPSGAALRAERAEVNEAGLALPLAAEGRAVCDLAAPDALRWVEAEAAAGDLLLAAAVDPTRELRRDRRTATGRDRAATLAFPGEQSALVASPDGSSASVHLHAISLSTAAPAELAAGRRDLRLPPRSARELGLPAGPWRAELALEAGAALWLGDAEAPEGLVWAAEGHRAESLATAARRALAVNPTGAEKMLQIDLRPISPGENAGAIATAGRFERLAPRAGTARLDLPPAARGAMPSRLRVEGAEALLLGADGSLARGPELAVPAAGGTLWLDHGPGPVAVWPAGPETGLEVFGFPRDLAPEADSLPGRLPGGNGARLLALAAGEPALLSLRSPAPLVAALLSPDGRVVRAGLLPAGGGLDLPLPPEGGSLALRGLAGAPLPPGIEIARTPLAPLGEGVGAPLLLAPGEARGFAFTLAEPRRVGLAVRAEEGAVEGELLEAGGRSLSTGVLHWRELPAGSYVLVLGAPGSSPPALAAPVALGLVPGAPGGPPGEELRRLRELAAAPAPPPPGAVAGAEALPAATGLAPAEAAEDETPDREIDR